MTDVIAGEAPSAPPNAERFEALYDLYARRVRAYLAAYVNRTWRRTDYDLVQDLAQDTWERVWRSLPSLRAADRNAFGWLATIARRAVIAHFRRARNRRELAADFSSELGALRLPLSPSAEDEAVAVMVLVRMLLEPPGTVLLPLPRRRPAASQPPTPAPEDDKPPLPRRVPGASNPPPRPRPVSAGLALVPVGVAA